MTSGAAKTSVYSMDYTMIFGIIIGVPQLFKTGSIDVVKDCQSYFAIDLPNSLEL